jgi:antitoxin CcdA
MTYESMPPKRLNERDRRATRVSLRVDLVEEAKRLNVDIDEACERGLSAELSKAWLEKNQAALESWNKYVEEHGLPLAGYRLF